MLEGAAGFRVQGLKRLKLRSDGPQHVPETRKLRLGHPACSKDFVMKNCRLTHGC